MSNKPPICKDHFPSSKELLGFNPQNSSSIFASASTQTLLGVSFPPIAHLICLPFSSSPSYLYLYLYLYLYYLNLILSLYLFLKWLRKKLINFCWVQKNIGVFFHHPPNIINQSYTCLPLFYHMISILFLGINFCSWSNLASFPALYCDVRNNCIDFQFSRSLDGWNQCEISLLIFSSFIQRCMHFKRSFLHLHYDRRIRHRWFRLFSSWVGLIRFFRQLLELVYLPSWTHRLPSSYR